MLTYRLVNYTKRLVGASGVVTAMSIAVVVALQSGSWYQQSDPVLVSQLFELSGIDIPRKYVPASGDYQSSPDPLEMLLNLPAIVPLVTAFALLVLVYAWLASLEKEMADFRPVRDPGRDAT